MKTFRQRISALATALFALWLPLAPLSPTLASSLGPVVRDLLSREVGCHGTTECKRCTRKCGCAEPEASLWAGGCGCAHESYEVAGLRHRVLPVGRYSFYVNQRVDLIRIPVAELFSLVELSPESPPPQFFAAA